MNQTPQPRIALGTVQLGMAYGIANRSGKPDLRMATAIVDTAWQAGVRVFDTAQSYGHSEATVGAVLAELGCSAEARVVSKLAPDLDLGSAVAIRQSVLASLRKLRVPQLYGLLLHREHLLSIWEEDLEERLTALCAEGLVAHLGVSVESPQGAQRAMTLEALTMLQVPSNALDRRFESCGVFDCGKQVFVRSILLQGLLLMDGASLPPPMAGVRPLIEKLDRVAADAGWSRLHLLLGYARTAYPEATILFGAETPGQVARNLAVWETAASFPPSAVDTLRQLFPAVDEAILNPAKWPRC